MSGFITLLPDILASNCPCRLNHTKEFLLLKTNIFLHYYVASFFPLPWLVGKLVFCTLNEEVFNDTLIRG